MPAASREQWPQPEAGVAHEPTLEAVGLPRLVGR
jgi:hypothetical protein